jgi:CheY-like chemotaxis protein
MSRILIVEDEIFVALDLENILLSAGHDVIGIAADRVSALDMAPDCDVALVDINLRDGATGPSVAVDLDRRYGAKVVFVTANPSQIGDAASAAMGVISKPFQADTVLQAVAFASGDGNIDPRSIKGLTAFTAMLSAGTLRSAGR